MSLLLALTIRGTVVLALVRLLDLAFRGRMRARSRRVWWILAPVSFLLPVGFPVFPPVAEAGSHATAISEVAGNLGPDISGGAASAGGVNHVQALPFAGALAALWLAGAIVYLLVVVVRTMRASRHWSRMRLSTDPALTGLLEDCKAAARITAPIGIAVSDDVPAPALLGWLRPRILLPASFVAVAPTEKLRAILLHELAHFRSFDIPLHWLQTLACAAHWFNPFAHLGARAWMDFREEAADECAIAWLARRDASEYGEAFVEALKHSRTFSLPLGALAVGESNKNIKQRMIMILNHAQKTPRALLALAIAIALAVTVSLLPVRADNSGTKQTAEAKTSPAVQAMLAWLKMIDEGKYEDSWNKSSKLFREQMTAAKWVAALKQVRAPLGACESRVLIMSQQVDKIPLPTGTFLNGTFEIAQFAVTMEKSGAMIETVTFEKESDGVWRASGYFIRTK